MSWMSKHPRGAGLRAVVTFVVELLCLVWIFRGQRSPRAEIIDPSVRAKFLPLREAMLADTRELYLAKYDGLPCPRSELVLEGLGEPARINTTKEWLFVGASRLYRSQNRIENGTIELIVKTSRLYHPHVWEASWTEAAFADSVDGMGIAPRVFSVSPNGKPSAQCRARTLVSEFVGERYLLSIVDEKKPVPVTDIAAFAARTIELLRDVHEIGFVHGDIHGMNYVFSNRSRLTDTLRLIDYGRTEPFITEQGYHVDEALAATSSVARGWEVDLLSPWDIQGFVKSRRDDMFRLAETLLMIGKLDSAYAARTKGVLEAAVAALAPQEPPLSESNKMKRARRSPEYVSAITQLKLERPFAPSTPQVFVDMYRDVVGLGFAQRPPYETWIYQLKQFSQQATTP